MKREHNDMKDIPFSENLVFYAPLTEGDLTDHISGVSPTTDSGCSVEWDSEKGMYRFTATNVWGCAATYEGLNMGLTVDHPITIVIDVAEVSFTGNRYSSMIGVPRWSSTSSSDYIGHIRYSSAYSPLTTLARYACTVDSNGIIRFFKDGAFATQFTGWTGRQLESNQVTICLNPTNCTLYALYAKDARIYNRALSASEVAQL